MTVRVWSIVLDAEDPLRLGRFWADALDWSYADHGGYTSATGPESTIHRLELVPAPNDTPRPGRMHFDLSSALEDQHAFVARLLDLGATNLDIGQGPDADHVVLADPEGNAFCVLEPGNGFVDHASRFGSLTCDGSPTVGRFWSEVLGWPLVWDQDDETAIRSSAGGALVTWGGGPEPKRGKNRLHIDVAPPPDGDQEAEVARLLALGARRIDIGQGDVDWVVLADPDDNELCVLSPR